MCRTGCPTQDHASWGDCARAANLRVGWAASARGLDLSAEKKWDGELQAYRDARGQGIQPASTKLRDVRKAVDASDRAGFAVQA